jgi:hypothetical protein
MRRETLAVKIGLDHLTVFAHRLRCNQLSREDTYDV